MKKNKSYLVALLFLLANIATHAQTSKVAVIKDTDGYVNVRSGPGKDFGVLAVINAGEPFYCENNDTEWVKIHTHKTRNGAGYVHSSRLQLVELLPPVKQKELITSIFEEQKRQAMLYQSTGKKVGDTEVYYSDRFYSPMLAVLPSYFCATKDSELIWLLFATMWADIGSANEMPSIAVGECFACQTDIMMTELTKLDREQLINIIEQIEWGLMNMYGADEDGQSDNPEYNRLMKRLNTAR